MTDRITYACQGPRDAGKSGQGCGEDLTVLIEAVPEDGEVHEFHCPKCGNVGTARKIVPKIEA